MAKIISTIVEDAPKDIFLIAEYYESDYKDDEGNLIKCADILPVHKKVNMFEDDGDMTVRYYTQNEWDGTTTWCSDVVRGAQYNYAPRTLSHQAFLCYLNACLKHEYIEDIAEDFKDGEEIVSVDQLAPRSKELLEYVMNWDHTTPFEFKHTKVYQETEVIDGKTYYVVRCFKVK